MSAEGTIVAELRALILAAAPEPERAAAIADCDPDAVLDTLMPFSSVIVLGAVVAVEDRWGIVVDRAAIERATAGGVTLRKLAAMVLELGGGEARG